MDIQARKLNLIEEFIQISDESLITKLENLISSERKPVGENELSSMSLSEFHEMIDKSIADKNEGKVILHQDLKQKIKSW